MGNISASILCPSPKTAGYKVLGWFSQKLRWKDFEFPDHVRRVVKTTVTIDIQKAPATALRRHLRQRLNRHHRLWQFCGPILTTWPQLSHYPLRMCKNPQTTGSKGFLARNIIWTPRSTLDEAHPVLTSTWGRNGSPTVQDLPNNTDLWWLMGPPKYPCI